MSKELKVFDIGSPVTIAHIDNKNVNGMVLAIYVNNGGVEYDVVYWSGSDRKRVTVSELEISSTTQKQMKIGFR